MPWHRATESPLAAWRSARLASATLVAAAIGAGLSGCGGRAADLARPKATAAVPGQAAVTNGARWLTGPAGKLLTALNADVGQIGAALRASQHGAAGRAGARLAAGATAALDGPTPPADARIYWSALKDFERAGNDIASRKYGPASLLIAVGDVDITKVTAAANNLDRPARP